MTNTLTISTTPTMPRGGTPGRPARLLAPLLLALALLATGAQAQMGPGGGGPPGGGGGGMQPPSGCGASPRGEREQRQPTLEDLMPPDPWRLWAERLQHAQPTLALTAPQQAPFAAFVRELDEAARLNTQRVMRGARRAPAAVSATVDVARDLRQEADDARDWLAALNDLSTRWAALAQVLTPAQKTRLDTLYTDSREAARAARPDGHRPPGR